MENLRTFYVTYRIIILHGKYLVATSYQLTSFINTCPQAWQYSNTQLQLIGVRQNKKFVHETDMPIL